MKVWMLTGDKVETTTCISISAGVKSKNQKIFTIKYENLIDYNEINIENNSNSINNNIDNIDILSNNFNDNKKNLITIQIPNKILKLVLV